MEDWSISVSEPLLKLKNTKKSSGPDKWELILVCPEEGEGRCNCTVFFFIYGQSRQNILFIVTFIKMLAEKRWEWSGNPSSDTEPKIDIRVIEKYMHLIHI